MKTSTTGRGHKAWTFLFRGAGQTTRSTTIVQCAENGFVVDDRIYRHVFAADSTDLGLQPYSGDGSTRGVVSAEKAREFFREARAAELAAHVTEEEAEIMMFRVERELRLWR